MLNTEVSYEAEWTSAVHRPDPHEGPSLPTLAPRPSAVEPAPRCLNSVTDAPIDQRQLPAGRPSH